MMSVYSLEWKTAREIPGGFIKVADLPEYTGSNKVTVIKTFDEVKVILDFCNSSFGFLEYGPRTKEAFGGVLDLETLDLFIKRTKSLVV